MNNLTLREQIEEATENNDHTLAVMIKAAAVGGTLAQAYMVVLNNIADVHEIQGYMNGNNSEMRSCIDRDLTFTLELRGEL